MSRSLDICIASQQLTVLENERVIKRYPVSTAKKGPGQLKGSECTPTGRHKIRAKIGAGAAINSVFIGRRFTGEIYTPQLAAAEPKRDWILSRILWLSGLEPGFNRYGEVDTAWRYIYIHGCPDHLMLGMPASHGCIRMHNADVIELFDSIDAGCPVFIHE
ncbi:L,D-transpeptidase [Methylomonas rivi]|uniref:L,D-transpeptidase n=1 Tax=Methylomonas rivi TaxID=2952226 RepID=A0ABT1TZY3_9GAMM|nr:L,D-transpeptidase [Methylomonas sp. WSC-6]MBS4050685.1 L,D-transpeptidase [Methylomonas sp.]MCQ8127122.1 L,D-transpeptidase [Methylomonas sp. WSC-6]